MEQENEIWKEVKGFEDYYIVSSIGNVMRKEGTSHLESKKLKMLLDKDGYHRVNLKVNQKGFNRLVHRLMCQAFLQNPDDKPQVNHINGIKGDNRLENLEWCTLSENRQHAYDTGLQNSNTRKGSKNNFAKLSKEDVLKIRSLYKGDLRGVKPENYNGRITMKQISSQFNVTDGCIRAILKNKNWKHI